MPLHRPARPSPLPTRPARPDDEALDKHKYPRSARPTEHRPRDFPSRSPKRPAPCYRTFHSRYAAITVSSSSFFASDWANAATSGAGSGGVVVDAASEQARTLAHALTRLPIAPRSRRACSSARCSESGWPRSSATANRASRAVAPRSRFRRWLVWAGAVAGGLRNLVSRHNCPHAADHSPVQAVRVQWR